VRYKNWSNTQLYCEHLAKGERAIESRDVLPPLARAGEIAGFGLRMNAGWPFELFEKVTGFDMRNEWATEMDQLVRRGYAEKTPERFHLTAEGLRFADYAIELFLRT
jgi:coproporphyrinogen III oxidase-like Fe-S oxidoreductase